MVRRRRVVGPDLYAAHADASSAGHRTCFARGGARTRSSFAGVGQTDGREPDGGEPNLRILVAKLVQRTNGALHRAGAGGDARPADGRGGRTAQASGADIL